MKKANAPFLSADEQNDLAGLILRLAQHFDGPQSLTSTLNIMTNAVDKHNPEHKLAELAIMQFSHVTGNIRQLLASPHSYEHPEMLFQSLKPLLDQHASAINDLQAQAMDTDLLPPNCRGDFCAQLGALKRTLGEMKTLVDSKVNREMNAPRDWRSRTQDRKGAALG